MNGTGVYLAFGSQWSGIKLAAIDPQTGKLANPSGGPGSTQPAKLDSLASRPASGPIEASFLWYRDGYYYLFASFNDCCMGAASNYEIVIGRSRSIAGPYRDRQGRLMTQGGGGTLVLASNARFHGPGHNAVLANGDTDELVYHTYDAQNQGIADPPDPPAHLDRERTGRLLVLPCSEKPPEPQTTRAVA